MSSFVGGSRRIEGEFRDSLGILADPTTVRFYIKPGGQSYTMYTYGTDLNVGKTGTGYYYCDVPLTVGGVWYFYEIEGVGVLASGDAEGFFWVEPHYTRAV